MVKKRMSLIASMILLTASIFTGCGSSNKTDSDILSALQRMLPVNLCLVLKSRPAKEKQIMA